MYRREASSDVSDVIAKLLRRIETLEALSTRQALPSGYEWDIVTGTLVVRRKTDGAIVVVM